MRRDYFSRLRWAARWYLPPAEAAEMLEDYREIVEGRSEEELRRDVGTPKDAVGRLVELKAYHRWLTVFAVLAVCVVLPSVDTVWSEISQQLIRLFDIWLFVGGIAQTSRYAEWMLPLGTVLALAWFRHNGRKEQALSKWLAPLLAFLLLGIAWVSFLAWTVFAEQWDLLNSLFPENHWLLRFSMGACALAAGVIGMLGLIKARLTDRRWLAAYTLGLTGAVACVFVWKLFSSMSPDFSPGWQTPLIIRYTFITLLGLLGTGVALC